MEKILRYVLIRLYAEVTCRDDYGKLNIVTSLKDATDGKENYIVTPRSGTMTIVINSYKTSKKYGQIKASLSQDLSKLIRTYIAVNEITDYLFGKSNLSPFVTKSNKKMDLNLQQ